MKAAEIELEVLQRLLTTLAESEEPYPSETGKNGHKYDRAVTKYHKVLSKKFQQVHNKLVPTGGEA